MLVFTLPYFLRTVYLFLAMRCLHCCAGFPLVVVDRGYSLAVHRLTVVASLVAEHRLQGAPNSGTAARGLSSCVSWALERMLSSYGTQA